jgi:hypothetical protein
MSKPSFVQVAEAHSLGSAIAVSLNVASGDVLVIYTSMPTINASTINISDTLGTNFTNVITFNNGNTLNQQIVAGLLRGSGQDIVSATFDNSALNFLSVSEYTGFPGSFIIDHIDTSSGSQFFSNSFTETLPIASTSLLIATAIIEGVSPVTSGPSMGSLRAYDPYLVGPGTINFAYFDNTSNVISAQYFGSGSTLVGFSTLGFGLGVPPPPPPVQRPAAIFATPVVSNINRSQKDRLYPYKELQVISTDLAPIPFVCPHCRAPNIATIYRDVRDYSVSVGIPNINQGGMAPGQSFDFVGCAACGYWYRKNDYKRVPPPRIYDVGIAPSLVNQQVQSSTFGGGLTTAFTDGQAYQANISGIDTKILLESNMYGFTDDGFERTGFIVQALPTGSIEPS